VGRFPQRGGNAFWIPAVPPGRKVVLRGYVPPGNKPPDQQEGWAVPKEDLELYDTQGGTFGEDTPSHLRDDIANSGQRRWRTLAAFAIGAVIIGGFAGAGGRHLWRRYDQAVEGTPAASKRVDRREPAKTEPVAFRERGWKMAGGEGDRVAWRSPYDGSLWIELTPGSQRLVPYK